MTRKHVLDRIAEETTLTGTFSIHEPGNPQRADFDALIERAKQPGWVGSDEWTQLREEDWIRVSNKIARIVLRKAEEIKKTGDETQIKLMTAREHFADDIRYVVDMWLHRWSGITKEIKKSESLIGKFFHSYDKETGLVVHWQGHVLGEPTPGVFLVQLFSWIAGEPTDQLVIPISQIVEEHWKFYVTQDEWNFAYQHRYNADAADKRRTAILNEKKTDTLAEAMA